MDKKPIEVIKKNQKFKKPNIIINIINQKSLSLKSKKVYNLLIKKLLTKNKDEFVSQVINTSYSELARELGTTKSNDISDILNELQGHKITFEHLLENEPSKANSILLSEYLVEKKSQNGLVISFPLFLTKELIKYNNKKYAKLDLIELNKLNITHSITLYEMFRSTICNYDNQPKDFTESELRKRLGLEDKYKNVQDFNKDVIRKSIDDINNNMSINIELLKIVKPTKTNDIKERTYKFFVVQDKTKTLNFTDFINYIESLNQIVSCKIGAHTYSYENDDFLMESSKKKYWLRGSGQKAKNEMRNKIWEKLFSDYIEDREEFSEKYSIDF